MGASLLLLTYLLLAVSELGRKPTESGEPRPWQGAILFASAALGVLIVLITEALSLIHSVSRLPLTVAWLAITLAVLIIGLRQGSLEAGWRRIVALIRTLGRAEWILIACLSILAVLVLLVAWVAPPNNVDTLQYHMPRVLHWAQAGDLNHFATPYDSETSRPYWAEVAILNLRTLWGGDRPANLPQVASLLGVVVAASGIARLLGGSRRTQILAAAMAFAVPMALLQASTPKNDIVLSFWVMSTAYFVGLESRLGLDGRERLALAACVALAMLTKGTGIPFVAGLLLWYATECVRRRGFRRTVVENAPAILIVALVNGPFWVRNIATYGGPYGVEVPVGLPAEEGSGLDSADESGQTEVPPTTSGLEPYLSRVVRMAAMHFVTPIHAVNEALFRAMRPYPRLFPDAYIQSLEFAAWNHEMTGGNPLHFLLIGLAFAALIFARRGGWLDPLLWLSLSAAIGLFLISFSGCIDIVFCMRYELSFFHLTAPVVAVVIYRLAPRAITASTALLLLYAVPYVLINNMRPVIGMPPWPTRIRSVFVEDPEVILFAQSPEIRDEYHDVAQRILEAACGRVGLVTTRFTLEYTLWRLLGAPESGIVIEHVQASPDTARHLDPDFSPCAVICTECDALPEGFDLPLAADFGHVRLYLESDD